MNSKSNGIEKFLLILTRLLLQNFGHNIVAPVVLNNLIITTRKLTCSVETLFHLRFAGKSVRRVLESTPVLGSLYLVLTTRVCR